MAGRGEMLGIEQCRRWTKSALMGLYTGGHLEGLSDEVALELRPDRVTE